MEEERFVNAYTVNEQGENIMWKGNKLIQEKKKKTVGDSHKKRNRQQKEQSQEGWSDLSQAEEEG